MTFAKYIREIVYGGIDGIITTFAVVSGFSGASLTSGLTGSLSTTLVLLFGFANLFADGVSMGLGNFLSLRSAKKLYLFKKKGEETQLKNNKQPALLVTEDILRKHNFSDEDIKTLISIFQKNEDYWVEFMIQNTSNMRRQEYEQPMLKGIAVFISFIIFGFIPIIPFILLDMPSHAFIYSILGVFSALVALGCIRGYITKESIFFAIVDVLLVGGIAGSVAFFVGSLF